MTVAIIIIIAVVCVAGGFGAGVWWVTHRLPQVLAHMTPQQRLVIARQMTREEVTST